VAEATAPIFYLSGELGFSQRGASSPAIYAFFFGFFFSFFIDVPLDIEASFRRTILSRFSSHEPAV
jgi:hypothetical protein